MLTNKKKSFIVLLKLDKMKLGGAMRAGRDVMVGVGEVLVGVRSSIRAWYGGMTGWMNIGEGQQRKSCSAAII